MQSTGNMRQMGARAMEGGVSTRSTGEGSANVKVAELFWRGS